MTDTFSKGQILAFIQSISEKNAIKYGSLGIQSLTYKETLPNGDRVYTFTVEDTNTGGVKKYDFIVPKGDDGLTSYLGTYDNLGDLSTAHPTGRAGEFALISENNGKIISFATFDTVGSKWSSIVIGDNLDLFANVEDNSVPYKKADGTLDDIGLYALQDGTPFFEKDPQIKSDSLRVSDALKINEKSAVIGNHSNISGKDYFMVDVEWSEANGSKKRPTYFETDSTLKITPNTTRNVRTQLNKFNFIPTSNFIATIIYFYLENPIDNLCFRIKSNITGLYIHYFPNRKAWEDNVGGYHLGVGETFIDIHNNPIAPLSSYNYDWTFEFNQVVPFMGDGSKPYLAFNANIGNFVKISKLQDLGDIQYKADIDSNKNYTLEINSPDGTDKKIDVNSWFHKEPKPTTPFYVYHGFSNQNPLDFFRMEDLSAFKKVSRYHYEGDYDFSRSATNESFYWICIPEDKISADYILVGDKHSEMFTKWTVNNTINGSDGIVYKAFKNINKTTSDDFILTVK